MKFTTEKTFLLQKKTDLLFKVRKERLTDDFTSMGICRVDQSMNKMTLFAKNVERPM